MRSQGLAHVIDLHCHILPGIDDGATEIGESLALARVFADEGGRTVAATPHLRSDHPGVIPAELAERCRSLNEFLTKEGVPIRVVAGGEVDLLWAQSASSEEIALASYGQRGTDLLVETPYGPLPPAFEELLFKLQREGFRILLAHPERNASLQRDPRRIGELTRNGVLIQVTASSLVREGRRSRLARLARALVEDGMAHVIASDTHSLAGPERASLAQGLAAAGRIAPARSSWMVTEVPQAILAGEPLPPAPEDRPTLGRRLRRGLSAARL